MRLPVSSALGLIVVTLGPCDGAWSSIRAQKSRGVERSGLESQAKPNSPSSTFEPMRYLLSAMDAPRVEYFDKHDRTHMHALKEHAQLTPTSTRIETIHIAQYNAGKHSRFSFLVFGIAAWLLGVGLYLYGDNKSEGEESSRQTFSQATANIVNMFIGAGLWSVPFSIYLGGWVAFPLSMMITCIVYFTSRELVKLQLRHSSIAMGNNILTYRDGEEVEQNEGVSHRSLGADPNIIRAASAEESKFHQTQENSGNNGNALVDNRRTHASSAQISRQSSVHWESREVDGQGAPIATGMGHRGLGSQEFMFNPTQIRADSSQGYLSHQVATQRKRVDSYLDVVEAVLGINARRVATVFVTCEYLGIAVVLTLNLWDMSSRALEVPIWVMGLSTTLMVIPFLLKTNWGMLAYVNFFSVVVLLTTISCIFARLEASDRTWGKLTGENRSAMALPTASQFVLCFGVQLSVFAGGAPSVPTILNNSIEKRNFIWEVLRPSFIVIALLVMTMAIGGFGAYGSDVMVFVSDNVTADPDFGLPLALLIGAAIIATLPSVITLAAELLAGRESRAGEGLLFRLAVYFVVIGAAIMFLSHLDVVLEITGLLCMSFTAIIIPLVMSLTEFWDEDSTYTKVPTLFRNLITQSPP
mmetsp:Transcript_17812/g.35931  ORF Transcript_17812/g.35931 Transcript_17812/m.35931 type:complete len:641 (-) Transcript_17812:465-2387(-)